MQGTDELLELMRKKIEAFTKMLEITMGQHKLIEDDDVEGFSFSMTLRQNCISNIEAYDARMRTIIESRDATGDEEGLFSELSDTVVSLIYKISEADEENRTAAARKLLGYRDALKEASVSQKAVRAYLMIDEENSIYFDQKK